MTSKINYHDVHTAIRDTVHHILGMYFENPVGFLSELGNQHGVISGSLVLYIMLSINFSAGFRKAATWKPRDLDIYVPENEAPPLLTYLTNVEHYSLLPPEIRQPHTDEPYPGVQIRHIIHLQKKGRYVDVIVSNSFFAAAPVFNFHSTPLFNFITGNGLFSAYPEMTCNYRGLFNPRRFTLGNHAPALPPAHVKHALLKYVRRGFDIRRNPSSWEEGTPHVCEADINCPHTCRNIEDRGCLYVTFCDSKENMRVGMRTGSVTVDACRGTRLRLLWQLGGQPCRKGKDGKKGLEGFITCRPVFNAGSVTD